MNRTTFYESRPDEHGHFERWVLIEEDVLHECLTTYMSPSGRREVKRSSATYLTNDVLSGNHDTTAKQHLQKVLAKLGRPAD